MYEFMKNANTEYLEDEIKRLSNPETLELVLTRMADYRNNNEMEQVFYPDLNMYLNHIIAQHNTYLDRVKRQLEMVLGAKTNPQNVTPIR